MSDTSQGPGWWLASDGKWYPPELWTGPPAAGPLATGGATTPPAQPASGAPPQGAPAYGAAPYGAAPSGSGPGGTVPPSYPGYGYGYGEAAPYGVPAARKTTNGMAVASLVCGCVGFIFFLPAILAVIFGFVARSQIRRSLGSQSGDGLALAGIICGFAWIALFVVIFALSAANTNSSSVVDHVALAALGGLT